MLKDKINIKIIKNFESKIMNNKRNIRIYLPPSYSAQPDKYYPVLYVHDGQNVFDALESYKGFQKVEPPVEIDLVFLQDFYMLILLFCVTKYTPAFIYIIS